MVQVASAAVARPAKKPKKGQLYPVHVLLASDLVDLIDRFAQETGDPLVARMTRTEAIRILIVEGLKKRGLVK